jgi:DNA-binding transcriptional ArsR family regulator
MSNRRLKAFSGVDAGSHEENALKQKAGASFRPRGNGSGAAAVRSQACVFAALGDETRLGVLSKLVDGRPQSIARLTEGTILTRQAVTKHLRVLEEAGLVRSVRNGRESLFAFEQKPLDDARLYLDRVSRQWDDVLARLKSFVEE